MKFQLFIIALLFLACSSGIKAQDNLDKPLSTDDEIRLILLKQVLQPYLSGKKYTICVAVDDTKNPSKSLLSKLEDVYKSIKPNTSCYIDHDKHDSVVDSMSGKEGAQLTVSKLIRVNKNVVQAKAGSYIDNMGSERCLYTLKKQNNLWEISSVGQCSISWHSYER